MSKEIKTDLKRLHDEYELMTNRQRIKVLITIAADINEVQAFNEAQERLLTLGLGARR